MDGGRSGNYGRGGGRAGYNRPQGSGGRGSQYQPRPQAQRQWVDQRPQQGMGRGTGGGRTGAGNPWGQPPTLSSFPVQSPARPPRSSSDELDIQSLKISPQQPLSPRSPPSEGEENRIQPMRRPDQGGQKSVRSIKLVVNHFPVNFDPRRTIFHYDVDVKPVTSGDNRPVKKIVRKSDLRLIRDKFCSDYPDTFPILKTAYDGEKNLFSAVVLPTGQYKVKLSDEENVRGRSYLLTIRFVNELKLCKLKEYLRGELSHIPRDVLQGLDLVMRENPARQRICVGKSFYSDYKKQDDLRNGVAVYKGFNQSLKSTSQGPILCVDYSVLAFYKPMSVTDFLTENVPQINSIDDIKRYRPQAIRALKGKKVRVTHRPCQQKFPIVGLAEKDTCHSWFDLVDREGKNPPKRTSLVAYFQEKWGRKIENLNIPCLQLGRGNKLAADEVPMEFCVLVEGQVCPKEDLDNSRVKYLKDQAIPRPGDRRRAINETLQANDGPCGVVISNFGIQVDQNMTKVVGRVIGAPELRIGGSQRVKVDGEKCQWNLTGDRRLVDGKSVLHWALIDFTDGDRYEKLAKEMFIGNLKSRCGRLGIRMDDPLVCLLASMRRFSSAESLEDLLKDVVDRARIKSKENLQLIVCVMTRKDPGYKLLKWVSETKIGVLTQCCLSSHANKGQDQYLANLCLKINVKLGGSNFELMAELPHFVGEDHVMFIGADVNHPAPNNATCPSIAAVVGTVNWPAANRYAARVSPQVHRQEKISNFGGLCLDLIKIYAGCNNRVKPNKIVIFRDGVSDDQFGMVLAEELRDIKNTIYEDHYKPKITLIVAQKRHHTRLFGESRNDVGPTGNVPPGTVVDTVIVHPFHFDFYLCSHYGGLGTSKPTHYYVLLDENLFSSDRLQKLIYDMCFTFARCTKPVSLVPPVYYADLVAYRGRMFQEAAMESQYLSPPSSCHAISSTSLSTAWCDQSVYNLHPELENVMFFV